MVDDNNYNLDHSLQQNTSSGSGHQIFQLSEIGLVPWLGDRETNGRVAKFLIVMNLMTHLMYWKRMIKVIIIIINHD